MSTTYDFRGRNVLVTGGASGLGKATVKKFLESGAKVFALDRDEENIAKLASEHPEVTTITVDLSNWEDTAKSLQSIGPIHHLVNNAGIAGPPRKFLDIKPTDVDTVFDINFKAIINVSQAVASEAIRGGIEGATIVNISSVMSRIPYKSVSLYCASKAAVSMLTKSMAVELAPHNIRVVAVCPTIMETNMTRPGKPSSSASGGSNVTGDSASSCTKAQADPLPKFMNFLVQKQISKRLLTVDETADLILYLSSASSSMMIGEDVCIDGGMFAN